MIQIRWYLPDISETHDGKKRYPVGARNLGESIRVVLETPASRLTKPLPDSAEFTKRNSAAAAKALEDAVMAGR